jgi:hypothetical protein
MDEPAGAAAVPAAAVEYVRASGECLCDVCGLPYRQHPHDPEVIGYDDRPFLRVVCGGQRVKL